MSYTIILLKDKINLEGPSTDQPTPMGSVQEIMGELEKLHGDAIGYETYNSSYGQFGVYWDDLVRIEIGIGKLDQPVLTVGLRLWGNPYPFLRKTCDHLGWHAYDGMGGGWMDLDNPDWPDKA